MGPIRSHLTHLDCSLCSVQHEVDRWQSLCRECGAVLLARYDLGAARTSLRRDEMGGRPATLWRYAEVLPGSEAAVTLGEGWTPMHRAQRLGERIGLRQLWIKDESVNPTASFKARGMTAAVTMARKQGATRLALPSAGNAGGAAAAYGALAGMKVDLFLPRWTPQPFILEAEVHGATVHLLDGDIADCGAVVREQTAAKGWFDLSTLKEPYRLEGKKTMGYELAEHFEGDLPDVVIYPTGGGTGLIGMWKAFDEMQQLGWLNSTHRPRMVVVQADGCAPIVNAFEAGQDRATRVENPQTYASGLRVPAAVGDHLILGAVRQSDGIALTVSDRQMAEGQAEIGSLEGIYAAPEGGATLAACRQLIERGWITADERVVLFNTGSGLKYPDPPEAEST